MNWYQMESQEVMDKLNRFKDRGLSQKEVIKRQRHYGKNELQSEKGPGFFRQFAAQFKDFMILTLLAAAGISFFASYAQGGFICRQIVRKEKSAIGGNKTAGVKID